MNNSVDILSLPKHPDNLAHAYIVEGIDIKKRLSNIQGLTRSLLCQTKPTIVGEYCGHCHSCNLLNADTHPDFMMVNADEGTIGVDDVRAISQFLSNMSHLSGNQVVVVEHAENMTENASNALLKTLEEPTNKCFIFLLCKNKSILLPTILSRCQFVQINNKTKEQLQIDYPDLPAYILGFSANSESELNRWIETDEITKFIQIYELFITWLKNKTPNLTLINAVIDKPLKINFLLYLFEKRIRQLVLKQEDPTSSLLALKTLLSYRQKNEVIKGMNKTLALTDLVNQLSNKIC